MAHDDDSVARPGTDPAAGTTPSLLAETVAAIGPPDQYAISAARERQERLTKPSGSLGTLEDLSVRLAGLAGACPPPLVSAFQQIQASSYDDVSAFQTEQCTDTDGGFDLGFAQDGSWAEYRNVDFGAGATSVNVRVASAGTGGTLEFHLDSLAGPVIAQALIPVTGGWQTWTTVTASVSAAAGVRVLYVVVKHSGGTGGIGNLNWFQFQP